MKSKIIKIMVILSLFIVYLSCCFFSQTVYSAGKLNAKDVTTGQIEKNYNSTIFDRLQVTAEAQSDVFFNFDCTKVLKNAKKNGSLNIMNRTYENYAYNSRNVICVSPEDHEQANYQQIRCVLDVLPNGNVKVTKVTSSRGNIKNHNI